MLEYWGNFLLRNWSFLVFLFYGQMRSYQSCLSCGKENISYEVFNVLSQPMPGSGQVTMRIMVLGLSPPLKEGDDLPSLDLVRQKTLNYDMLDQLFNSKKRKYEPPLEIIITVDADASYALIEQKVRILLDV